jgi:hypothetical protein
MKIFFDTNAYVAEALLGEAAAAMLAATEKAGWPIYGHDHLLNELERVLNELGFSRRLALLIPPEPQRSELFLSRSSAHRAALV